MNPIIVLGMHRSGTSALTGLLQQAGVTLGRVATFSPFNLKGNRENSAIVRLHERLFAFNGGAWHTPPDIVDWAPEHRAARDAIIAHFADIPRWGFKDPRTLFTLDGWLEAIPNPSLIGIFRHPQAVARSLARRNGLPLDRSYQLWEAYNLRLLAAHERSAFPLLCFDLPAAEFMQGVEVTIRALQLGFQGQPDFFEDRLRTSVQDRLPLPSSVEQLYRTLCERRKATRE